ncbi:13793_t:CDS:2 [Cetraspora pellucida]|uniref:13793_t:CDS:1 n=1 Tax=Cetraspora pellucida TaxID=1433469 RepID=A0ACA9KCS5_9GLOM|nr:13793_t:CDS:2 [Cetraspora pellucida]
MLLTSAVSLAITTISVTFPVKEASNDRDFRTVSFIRINDSEVRIISKPISLRPTAFEDVKVIQMEGYDELIVTSPSGFK